jgi:hypothetical protein
VAAFDVKRVLQRPDPAECSVVYQAFEEGEYLEISTIVVGTFDDTMARIEEKS